MAILLTTCHLSVALTLAVEWRSSRRTASVAGESGLGMEPCQSGTGRRWYPHSTGLPWHHTAAT